MVPGRTLTTIAFLLCTAQAIWADTYDLESFKTRLKPLETDAKIVALCRDFFENATDFDVVRQAQDAWKSADPDDALDYARQKTVENPTSARYAYLLGRLVDDKIEAVEIGRQAVEYDPYWPYGYRLVAAQYVYYLFRKQGTGDEQDRLAIEWDNDRQLVADLVELEPDASYALEFLRYAQAYDGDFAGMMHTLERGRGVGARWADGFAFAQAFAGQGQLREALRSVAEEVDYRIRERNWPAERREELIQEQYLEALADAGIYDEVIRVTAGRDPDSITGEDHYRLARLYALKGDVDAAFSSLVSAGDRGWDNTWEANRDTDLRHLRRDPRWGRAMAVIQRNWEAGREERRLEALSAKMDKEAPGWTLPAAEGNMVSLADLRGKVVVLDFWATWCGPCKLAMPMIDEFARSHATEDVLVFSINTWEKGRQGPAKYMRDHHYVMTLLYGNDELAKAYEVEAIPHLCVIDREGRIRFAESGVSERLLENLIFWTDDLLSEM